MGSAKKAVLLILRTNGWLSRQKIIRWITAILKELFRRVNMVPVR